MPAVRDNQTTIAMQPSVQRMHCGRSRADPWPRAPGVVGKRACKRLVIWRRWRLVMRTSGRFESCYVALMARLWADLEAILVLHCADDGASVGARERVGLRLEALLLDIALLWDKCEFLRWRGLLTPEQSASVRVIVSDLRDLLDVEPFDSALPRLGAAIVRAQNRLFDEVRCMA